MDGVNGCQFRDGVEFRRFLDRFLEDEHLRRQLSRGASETAQREFSAEAFGRRVAELYTSVLEQRSRDHAA